MPKADGIILILSYPDTIVRPAYWEPTSKICSKVGIGSKHKVQAGHAALLLIEKNNPEINYFDFGRYITTYGNGRVRSKETDVELTVPILAKFKNDTLINSEEILLWVENNPKKTHGDGRLVASINTEIDFFKAKNFINSLLKRKEIPYGVFLKNGSNCARFVTDTIIASTQKNTVILLLKKSNLFTPSPIGNVIKGKTSSEIYEIYNQKITDYKNRSVLKEYKTCFFNKFDNDLNIIGTELPNISLFNLENATWLGGIGSGAWFKVEEKHTDTSYKIARYTAEGIKDFEAFFQLNDKNLNLEKPYKFDYPSNCSQVYIVQNTKTYCLNKNTTT